MEDSNLKRYANKHPEALRKISDWPKHEKDSTEYALAVDLCSAVASNNLEQAESLLKQGADPNKDVGWWAPKNALFRAAEGMCSSEMIDLLVSYGADVNSVHVHLNPSTAIKAAYNECFMASACGALEGLIKNGAYVGHINTFEHGFKADQLINSARARELLNNAKFMLTQDTFSESAFKDYFNAATDSQMKSLADAIITRTQLQVLEQILDHQQNPEDALKFIALQSKGMVYPTVHISGEGYGSSDPCYLKELKSGATVEEAIQTCSGEQKVVQEHEDL